MSARKIVEGMMQGYGVIVVHPWSHKSEKTYFYCDGNRISENEFEWRLAPKPKQYMDENGTPYFLELNDISSQWYKKHKTGVLTVVVEREMDGSIYQIGIRNNVIWEKHGVTNGIKGEMKW